MKRIKWLASMLIACPLLTPAAYATVCDADNDSDVDRNDIILIFRARNQPAEPGDPRDFNGNGIITVADGRACLSRCTLPRCAIVTPPANNAPVADAGENQTVLVGAPVFLDGSGSSDVDGDALTFTWSISSTPASSQASLDDPAAVTPYFTVDLPGTYVVQLVVNDGTEDGGPDQVEITTGNSTPVADAGPDQTVYVGNLVQLDGSGSSDIDGDALAFSWLISAAPAGSQASLNNSTAVMPEFAVDLPGTYVIVLVVNDGTEDSRPDQVEITTGNSAPVADAGPDQTVVVGELVQLDGSGSSDVDNDPLNLNWTLETAPAGSGASLSSTLVPNPVFIADFPGEYSISLQVDDGNVTSNTDIVLVATENSTPVADAGPDQTAYVGDDVTLDGSGSSDADNDPLTFSWSFTSVPVDSSARFSDSFSATPRFTADEEGLYVAQLIVNDGALDSNPDTSSVEVEVYVSPDSDDDGLNNAQEAELGTDPDHPDSDRDGLNDGDEVYVYETDPLIEDTDDDGLIDGDEINTYDTDPLDPDSDGDGLKDGSEVNDHDTIPSVADTDADGANDGDEIAAGSDPNDNTSLPGGLPPNPSVVAPKLDQTVATTAFDATAFLYTGANPIQTGVAADTIDLQRAAAVRGLVNDRTGDPLAGVTIGILKRPEFGQTLTRIDGLFDLVVNGGGALTVTYQKDGYLPVQRQVDVPWQDFVWATDVVMIPVDTAVTTIDLTVPAMQVAQSSEVTDADGTRRATVLIPAGTGAEVLLANGTRQSVSSLNIRATEYTVGDDGPVTMPAELPATSAYTYAVELSADEAIAKINGKDVLFSQPVFFYVEDFLGFDVGSVAPSGYYDNQKGQWVADENGRVIKLLGVSAGLAELDTNGDDAADDGATLAALGVTDAEREQLATLYSPGQKLWRVPFTHFSTKDINWPAVAADGSEDPQQPEAEPGDEFNPCHEHGNSIIECQNQVVGERISVTGTPFTLNYRSSRVPGRLASNEISIPLTACDRFPGNTIPASLLRVRLEIRIAGRLFGYEYPAECGLSHNFTWDGKDAFGRLPQGRQQMKVAVGYVYPAVYASEPGQWDRAFARTVVSTGVSQGGARGGNDSALFIGCQSLTDAATGIQVGTGRCGSREPPFVGTKWQRYEVTVGALNAVAQGLGGWSVDVHHTYDPLGRVLWRGDGSWRGAEDKFNTIIETVAGIKGDGNYNGNNKPATSTQLNLPRDVAVGPDGSVYIADFYNKCVRRVDTAGIIHAAAGRCDGGGSNYGEGGPATEARLGRLEGIDVGQDGTLYLADSHHQIVRAVRDGIITTVAGVPNFVFGSFGGDGGPATAAKLHEPYDVAVGPDGSLFIADRQNYRIRRVGPDGIITTWAGTGVPGRSGDGGPAAQAQLIWPFRLAVGNDGSVYFSDQQNPRVRRISPDGIISTVAGGGTSEADGVRATEANLDGGYKPPRDGVRGLAVSKDGNLYIGTSIGVKFSGGPWLTQSGPKNEAVRYVGSDGIITTLAGKADTLWGYEGDGGPATAAQITFPEGIAVGKSGEIYVVDSYHHTVRRIGLALPGISPTDYVIPSQNGTEIYIFDRYGKHLQTRHALTDGVLFEFRYDGNGLLTEIEDGDGNVTLIERNGPTGKPTAIVSAHGQRTSLALNSNGYLESIANPANEAWGFGYSNDGLLTSITDPNGHSSSYDYDSFGRLERVNDPAGGFQTFSRAKLESGYEVTRTSALGRVTKYRVTKLLTGRKEFVSTSPNGLQNRMSANTDGSRTLSYADGTVVTAVLGPDPRFGMAAPLVKDVTLETPSGLSLSIQKTRQVTLSAPANGLEISTLADSYNVNGRNYSNVYDANADTITFSSPEGRQLIKTIESPGRILEKAVAGSNSIRFSYDNRGRIERISRGSGIDERTASYVYHENGYLAQIIDPLARTVDFERDLVGRVIKQTLPGDREINYSFDFAGNLVAVIPPGRTAHSLGLTNTNLPESYTPPIVGSEAEPLVTDYNRDRQLVEIDTPDVSPIGIVYDAFGRLRSLTFDGGSRQYSYDLTFGILTGISASNGSTLSLSYDGSLLTGESWAGEVTGSVSRSMDDNFRISTWLVNGSQQVNRTYDHDGLLIQVGGQTISRDAQTGFVDGTVLGNIVDVKSVTTFDELETYTVSYDGSEIFNTQFIRDKLGRIIDRTESVNGGPIDTYEYTYDVTGELRQVDRNQVQVSRYFYDENGNRLTHTSSGGSIAGDYDAQDRMVAYGAATYEYDAGGRLESKSTGPQSTQYIYDGLGNLIGVTLPSGDSVSYIIDGGNRRIGKKVNGVLVQRFLYKDSLKPIATLDQDNGIQSRFVYATRKNVPDFMITANGVYRLISDHIGSVRLVVDVDTGQTMQQLDYDEFGQVLFDSNPEFQPFGFAGGLYDIDTKLVHFGVREYDPEAGRWTTRDPILFGGGSTNLYTYVFNDPVNFVDPDGRDGGAGSNSGGEWVRTDEGDGDYQEVGISQARPDDPNIPANIGDGPAHVDRWCFGGTCRETIYDPETDTSGSAEASLDCHDDISSSCGDLNNKAEDLAWGPGGVDPRQPPPTQPKAPPNPTPEPPASPGSGPGGDAPGPGPGPIVTFGEPIIPFDCEHNLDCSDAGQYLFPPCP